MPTAKISSRTAPTFRELVQPRPVDSPRQQQKAKTRDTIVDAAIAEFREVGYPAAQVGKILKRANVSRATFYTYFRDKADLAHQIGARLAPGVTALFRELDTAVNPGRDDVRDFLEHYRQLWRVDKDLFEAVYEGNTVDRGITAKYLEWLPEVVHLLMPAYLERFEGATRERAMATFMVLLIQLERVLFMTQTEGAAFSPGDPLDVLADMWWHGLYGQFSSSR